MATELRPGTFTKIVVELDKEGRARSKVALRELSLVVEKQAKINASSGAHPYGTKTPAFPGTGPAVISGTLRRAITHTPVKIVGGAFECKVGMAPGFYPPYGRRHFNRTPASKYAEYLEKGLKNGTKYPFLLPAYKFAMRVPAQMIYNKAFGSAWRTIV